jgi:hypothetical protein
VAKPAAAGAGRRKEEVQHAHPASVADLADRRVTCGLHGTAAQQGWTAVGGSGGPEDYSTSP